MPHEPEHKRASPVVTPSTRVTVAFPFSTIKIHEPADHVARLALLVARLADLVAALEPSPAAEDLRRQAHTCAGELAG